MPPTQVFFFQDERDIPVRSWLQELRRTDKRVYAKCVARIRLLTQLGHELRRPLADYLEEDIYELRIRRGRVNYRILYFFHGQNMAILAHGLIKEDVIPPGRPDAGDQTERSFPARPGEAHLRGEYFSCLRREMQPRFSTG